MSQSTFDLRQHIHAAERTENMSNNTDYYFGAYLEIETTERPVTISYRACANGHKENRSFAFCPTCGAQIAMREVTAMERPNSLYDLLPDDEQLTGITPPALYGLKIIAIANTTSTGQWLVIDGDDTVEMLDFPTDAEVSNLKAALTERYAGTIAALRQHPAVLSVTVKAGYVLNTEY